MSLAGVEVGGSIGRRCRWLALALWGASLCGCLGDASESVTFRELPPRVGFEPLSEAMGRRCGALVSCHGGEARNYRVFGLYGLRLSPDDISGDLATPTTQAEHDANYNGTVYLEPERMTEVWQEGGARPERLTLIRPARGTEAHKGTWLFAEGDPGDRCLVSWLEGQLDEAACLAAAEARP